MSVPLRMSAPILIYEYRSGIRIAQYAMVEINGTSYLLVRYMGQQVVYGCGAHENFV